MYGSSCEIMLDIFQSLFAMSKIKTQKTGIMFMISSSVTLNYIPVYWQYYWFMYNMKSFLFEIKKTFVGSRNVLLTIEHEWRKKEKPHAKTMLNWAQKCERTFFCINKFRFYSRSVSHCFIIQTNEKSASFWFIQIVYYDTTINSSFINRRK